MGKREFTPEQKAALSAYWENDTPLKPADYPLFNFNVSVFEKSAACDSMALLGLGDREFSAAMPTLEHPDQIQLSRYVRIKEGLQRDLVSIRGATVHVSPNYFFACDFGGKICVFLPIAGEPLSGEVMRAIIERNERWGIEPTDDLRAVLAAPFPYELSMLELFEQPEIKEPELLTDRTNAFPIHTGQETDCLICSAGDGKRGGGWRNEVGRGYRVWENGGTHRVELQNLSSAGEVSPNFTDIEQLTGSQNSDFALAFFYIAGVLVPPMQPEKVPLIGAWIDLNDVIEKIGWMAEKPDAAKREQLRAQIWDFLQFGQRAVVVGKRSIPYRDPVTKQEISTQIESPVWAVTDARRPKSSGADAQLAPVKARVIISEQWETMLRDPLLCQHMPLGELLGSIAPHKVGGDWARLIGLSLARLFRMKPREMLTGEYSPTRRQLLTHYTPKTQTVESLLSSDKPKRAVTYYREALNILAEKGLIARTGDAAPDVTPATMLRPYGRQGWAEKWLDDESGVQIGELWRPAIQERAKALPERKPKDLKAKPHARKRAK